MMKTTDDDDGGDEMKSFSSSHAAVVFQVNTKKSKHCVKLSFNPIIDAFAYVYWMFSRL